MHICPSCNRSIPDGRYCPYCAAEQIPQRPAYPHNQPPFFNEQRDPLQRPKKNAIIVDENDFIIYDVAPQYEKPEENRTEQNEPADVIPPVPASEAPVLKTDEQSPETEMIPDPEPEPEIETEPDSLTTSAHDNLSRLFIDGTQSFTDIPVMNASENKHAEPESIMTPEELTGPGSLPSPELELATQPAVQISNQVFNKP